jgi:hypothetical protein
MLFLSGVIMVPGCGVEATNTEGLIDGNYQGKVYFDTGEALDSSISFVKGTVSIDGEIVEDVGYLYVDHYSDGRNERTITSITPGVNSLEIQYKLVMYDSVGNSVTGYCKTLLIQETSTQVYLYYEMAAGPEVLSFQGYLSRI